MGQQLDSQVVQPPPPTAVNTGAATVLPTNATCEPPCGAQQPPPSTRGWRPCSRLYRLT
jgi:hypothetical protein